MWALETPATNPCPVPRAMAHLPSRPCPGLYQEGRAEKAADAIKVDSGLVWG